MAGIRKMISSMGEDFKLVLFLIIIQEDIGYRLDIRKREEES